MFMSLYNQPLNSLLLPLDLPSRTLGVLTNALAESFILHTRNICDILLSRTTKPDDIRLNDILVPLPAALPPLVGRLRSIYGESNDPTSACWTFNKMLFHSTTHRRTRYDYSKFTLALMPPIRAIVQELVPLGHMPNSASLYE
jgi:hypothetical protein